jgi:hypothetical protein
MTENKRIYCSCGDSIEPDCNAECATCVLILESEIKQLKATRLEYAEAVLEALDSWGCYASDYFQKKWGYKEEVAKWSDIVKTLKKASDK